jgi:hypothetical protein
MEIPVGGNAVTEETVDSEVLENAKPEGGESDPQETHKSGETEEGRKKLGGWQRKIVKLETELEKWRDTALNLAQRPNPEPEKKAAPAEDKRPRKEDFIVDKEAGTYDADKYEDALLGWNSRQTKKEVLSELDKREQTKSQQSEQSRIEQSWREREAPVEAEYDDYQELSTVAVTFLQANQTSRTVQAIGAAITESELGPKLLRHLGEDYETLERIAKLSPKAAEKEIWKIEARLAPGEPADKEEADGEKADEPTIPPVKAQNKPPTPIKKVSPAARPFNPLDPTTWKDSRDYEQKMAVWEKKRLGS